MVTTEEDFWDFHSEDYFWFGVLGVFEIVHVFGDVVTFVLSTGFFFDYSRDKSGDCLDHDHGWSFTAERDELSDRYFLKLFRIFFFHVLFETVVNALVSGADEYDVFYGA